MNKKDIKSAIDTIGNDPYSQTRIKANIKSRLDDRKHLRNGKKIALSITALCSAMAVIIGLGLFNFLVPESNPIKPTTIITHQNNKKNKLVVMASAAENNSEIVYKEVPFDEELKYNMYIKVMDVTGFSVEERNNSFDILDADLKEYLNKYKITDSSRRSICGCQNNILIAIGYIDCLKIKPDNIDEISEISVKNTSKYGKIVYQKNTPGVKNYITTHGSKTTPEEAEALFWELGYCESPFTIKGEDFDFDNHNFYWEETEEFSKILNENINTPFSTFNDEITFTVKYKSGEICETTVLLTFNEDGSTSVRIDG